jgi:hypothetical protein
MVPQENYEYHGYEVRLTERQEGAHLADYIELHR